MDPTNPLCTFCHRPIDPEGVGIYRKVVGWAERRVSGGANAVRMAEPLDEWAHRHCIDLARRGHRFGQGSLM